MNFIEAGEGLRPKTDGRGRVLVGTGAYHHDFSMPEPHQT